MSHLFKHYAMKGGRGMKLTTHLHLVPRSTPPIRLHGLALS